MNHQYYPKRPVKSFQDLEVYQKTLGLAVEIVKRIQSRSEIGQSLRRTVLAIPRLIATSHSLRFGNPAQAIENLEKTMLNCNLAVYYLELFRDLINKKVEPEYFEEQIKEYLRVRGKIMRLQRSWLKFMKEKNEL